MIRAEFDPKRITAGLDEEFSALSKRVRLATEKTGREVLLTPLREMTREAFNSRKLPTSWRGKTFPDGGEETLSPAFFAHSAAPKIISAFEMGVEIAARNRRFLAVPTVESGVNIRHFRRGALTPEKWERENGVVLRFAPTSYGGVLIADEQRFRGKKRKGKATRVWTAKRQKPQVMFILLRRVRLRKRLDIAGIADRAGASYKIAYERAANAS